MLRGSQWEANLWTTWDLQHVNGNKSKEMGGILGCQQEHLPKTGSCPSDRQNPGLAGPLARLCEGP